jgi:phosphoadenosine phosphosulfate reductase
MEQLNMFGQTSLEDKVKRAIDRLRTFEPPEGYYLAFSGGKDSQCIYHLAKEAGVKFDAHYNLTTVDPPELVHFIKRKYPDVKTERTTTMWKLIVEKGLPTRMRRWCCEVLKEHGGEDRICVTGVRWAESSRRKSTRGIAEVIGKKEAQVMLLNDNEDERRMFENCQLKGKRVINPIIDWEDEDVWKYIKDRGLEYCELYDKGFDRLGCIGCPLSSNQQIEFAKYPKYKQAYIRAIGRFLPGYIERQTARGKEPLFTTAEDMFTWWLNGTAKDRQMDGQIEMDEFD